MNSARRRARDGGSAASERRTITDPAAIRALAHPRRLEILDHLGAHRELTVQQLAALTGDSTASISYHTRQLAAYGFIEPGDERNDKRVRPWRAVADVFDVLVRGAAPRARHAAAATLLDAQREHLDSALRAYAGVADAFDAEVRDATTFSITTAHITSEEMLQLRHELLAVLEPYRDRRDAPDGTLPVTIGVQIFVRDN